jgi:ribonuclease III family protein
LEQLFEAFLAQLNMKEIDIKTYSPLSLAYVGDSVYDFFVKYYLVLQGNRSTNEFHTHSKKFVKASEQAAILDRLSPSLTEDEQRIVKWGRKCKKRFGS